MELKRIYRSFREDVPEGADTVTLETAAIRREDADVTVVLWGAIMHLTLEAVDTVDVDCEVINLRTISPLDRETVLESVRKTGRCVVVHEAPKTGGIGAELIATINDEALLYLEAAVQRVTGFDVPAPLLSMEDYYLPHPPRIAAAIEEAAEF